MNGAGPGQTPKHGGLQHHDHPPSSTGSWIGLDIPLASFTGMAFTNLNQLLWLDKRGLARERGTFYIDNVYFWK